MQDAVKCEGPTEMSICSMEPCSFCGSE